MKTKRVAMGMLALGMAMSLLGGCGASKKLNLKKESFVVEYGNTVSTKASDYLDKGTEKEVLKKAKIALKVENEKDKEYLAVGKYKGTIAYEDEKVTFTVEVKDSVKPTLEDGFPKEVRVEANAVDVDLTKYFTATDLSDVTMTVKGDVDLSKTREYEVKVIATDAYKNKATKKAKIVVVSLEEAKANGVSAYVDGTKPQSEAMKQKIEEEKKAEQERQAQAQQSTATTVYSNEASGSSGSTSGNANGGGGSYVAPQEGYDVAFAQEVFNLINAERAARGLSVLPWDSALASAITNARAPQLVSDFSHAGLDAMIGFCGEWNGYHIGEVCAKVNGGGSAYSMQVLMNSPAHYEVMMGSNKKTMAVATYYANGWWYTCVNFIY